MSRLNGRVAKLEERAPAVEDKTAFIRKALALFRRIARWIDEGVITEREGQERIRFEPVTTPSQTDAWVDLEAAQRFIREAAKRTGWRSQTAPFPRQTWQLYRANSLGELLYWRDQVEVVAREMGVVDCRSD